MYADECDFVVLDKNKGDLYQFNLNGLCAAKDYEADSIKYSNGKVKFNICGFSNDHCLPGTLIPLDIGWLFIPCFISPFYVVQLQKGIQMCLTLKV
jgi:hypothetical protein